MPRPWLPAAIALALALAGCTSPAGSSASGDVPFPRIGDRAVYDVEGHLLELWRWNNGFPLTGNPPRIELRVEGSAQARDGFLQPHEALVVGARLDEGAGFRPIHTLYASSLHRALVQTRAPLSDGDHALAFDERGYPWAFGASRLHGETLTVGATFPFLLPANAWTGDPLSLAWRVVEQAGDRYRLRLEGNASTDWEVWMRAGEPYPQEVRVAWRGSGLAPFVRVDDAGRDLAMTARLASFERGSEPTRPSDPGAGFLDEPPSGEFEAWDGTKPPDGTGAYVPFTLREAADFAAVADTSFQSWASAGGDVRLSRATYFASPGDAPGTTRHAWLLQHVSPEDAFYESVVERVHLDATGSALLPRVVRSGPVPAPEGEHGWFPREALPASLLTLASGVAIMKEAFGAPGVQIFVRSFVEPAPGYGYYVDGGFERPKGRYSVIVNAQTGFIEAAVGPVEPLLGA